jgi:hypothetical protein
MVEIPDAKAGSIKKGMELGEISELLGAKF